MQEISLSLFDTHTHTNTHSLSLTSPGCVRRMRVACLAFMVEAQQLLMHGSVNTFKDEKTKKALLIRTYLLITYRIHSMRNLLCRIEFVKLASLAPPLLLPPIPKPMQAGTKTRRGEVLLLLAWTCLLACARTWQPISQSPLPHSLFLFLVSVLLERSFFSTFVLISLDPSFDHMQAREKGEHESLFHVATTVAGQSC